MALKEANETEYWILLLKDTDFIDEVKSKSIAADNTEIIKMLIASIKTAKNIR